MKKKHMPRWAKVLRNILLAALLGFLIWDAWDHPSFTFRANLRRMERRMLFPPQESAVELQTVGESYWIEVVDGAVLTAQPSRGRFFSNAKVSLTPLPEGPALVAFRNPVVLRDEFGQPTGYAAYAAFQPPENSVRAMLTLHNGDGDFPVEGIREENMFLFFARPEPGENGILSMGSTWFFEELFTYELVFYDDGGRCVGAIDG